MHSYGYTLLAGDILRLPLTRSFSTNKRSLKKPQGHVTVRPSSQEIGAYAADRNAGVSQNLLGISHSLQDILKPSINVVQVRRQPPAGIVGLADLLRDVPSFKAQVSNASGHPCTRSSEAAQVTIEIAIEHVVSWHAEHMHKPARVCTTSCATAVELSSRPPVVPDALCRHAEHHSRVCKVIRYKLRYAVLAYLCEDCWLVLELVIKIVDVAKHVLHHSNTIVQRRL